MKNPYTNRPVQRLFLIFSIMLLVGVCALFAFFTAFTQYYTRKNAEENLSFVVSRLGSELDYALRDIQKSAESLSVNTALHTFLTDETRYSSTQIVLDQYDQIASQSSHLYGAVIYDTDGHFYRYGSATFSNETCAALLDTVAQAGGYLPITVEKADFLCYVQRIYDLADLDMPHIGYIIVFCRSNTLTGLMEQYNIYTDLTLLLENGEAITVSTGPYDALPENTGSLYLETRSLKTKPYRLTVFIPKGNLFPYATAFIIAISVVIVLLAAMLVVYMLSMRSRVANPMDTVISEITAIGGNAHARLTPQDIPWIDRVVHNINDLLERIEEYSHRVFETQQKLYEAELNKQKMDLYLLRKQINAHFAYNSLNSIRAIAGKNGENDIEKIAVGLAELLRYSYSPEEYINIFDEMELITQYIDIMNIRFENRFMVEYDVDDRLCEYRILRQIIQPIVENALVHGLENKKSDCLLSISGQMCFDDGEYMTIVVKDNGIGIPVDKLAVFQQRIADDKTEDYSPTGIALVNIHRRIRLYFGKKYGLEIESAVGNGTKVTVKFPLLRDPAV